MPALALLLLAPAFAEPHRVPPAGLPDPLAAETRLLSERDAARLVESALEQTRHEARYDGAYRRIPYPMGDVPESLGVCTDVVIRAYRALGVDLQKEVHEDMLSRFELYPRAWGLSKPDPNIDHRRVLNLEVFLARSGLEVAAGPDPAGWLPGDLVTWTVPPRRPHIGLVTDRKSEAGVPLVVHNIGRGPKLEDVLFEFPITGHFRYAGPPRTQGPGGP